MNDVIVDAHAHVFRRLRGRIGSGEVAGLKQGRALVAGREEQVLPPFPGPTRFTVETLLAHMDWAGVGKAVLLQGPFYGEDNSYVRKAVRELPGRFIGAAYLDPWEKPARRKFASLVKRPEFRAVKIECSEPTGLLGLHPGARLAAVGLDWLWGGMEQYGLVLVLDLGAVGSRSYQTADVREIAERHPRLRIVIPHLGQPGLALETDPALRTAWIEQIDLGRLPNVWFDCAALPAKFAGEEYPYPSVDRYLREAFERIGPEKVMWGTDVPGLLVHATYPQLVRLGQLHTQSLTADQQALFMGRTARAVFGAARIL